MPASFTFTLHFTLPVSNSTTDGIPTPTAAVSALRTVSIAWTISSISASELAAAVGNLWRGPSRPP
jgi:hypothetical protein